MRTFAAFLLAGSLAALPAVAGQRAVKSHSVTNPAGSNSMTIMRSGTGANRTMTHTMTNTEGNKVLSSSRTITHVKKAHVKKVHVAKRSMRRVKVSKSHTSTKAF